MQDIGCCLGIWACVGGLRSSIASMMCQFHHLSNIHTIIALRCACKWYGARRCSWNRFIVFLKMQDIKWGFAKWACVGGLRTSTAFYFLCQIHQQLKTETFIAFIYACKWYGARKGSWYRFIVFSKMQDIGCCLAKWARIRGLRTSTASYFLSDPSSAHDWDIHSFSICMQVVWG